MRILSLSWYFDDAPEVTSAEFRSLASFLDYDVVFWHPVSTPDEYQSGGDFQGYPTLSEAESTALRADVQRRTKEIAAFLGLGRTFVAVVTPPVLVQLFSNREYSGTGRNARATTFYELFDMRRVLPVALETVSAEGTAIEVVAGEPYQAFWRAMRASMQYSAYFEKPVGMPLFVVKGTDKAVACRVEMGRGQFVLLPNLRYEEETDEEVKRLDGLLLGALKELLASLNIGEAAPLPEWTRQYCVPDEGALRLRLGDVERSLSELAQTRDEVATELAASEGLKRLITASGTVLEGLVRDGLEKLGATTEDGPPGRTEFVVRWGAKTAVVEVKGVTKSAKEQDAAQLEKWVMDQWDRDGKRPKGFLVVNAYRDLPLAERTADAFPHQMLKFCAAREHCLLTTVQLLGAVVAAAQDPRAGKRILSELFATIGPYAGYTDWKAFISQEPPMTSRAAD